MYKVFGMIREGQVAWSRCWTKILVPLSLSFLWLGAFFVFAGGLRDAPDAAAASTALSDVPPDDGPWVVRAYFDDLATLHDLASWREPWDVVHPRADAPGYVVLDVTRDEYARLLRLGFRPELDAELTAQLRHPHPRLPWQTTGIPGYPCYRTVEETFATAEDIVATYPDLASWEDIGDSWEKTQDSARGYDMQVLCLTNAAVSGPKPKLFVMSSVHAREYAPAELMTRFAEYLVENYGVLADVTWVLDYNEVHLLLQANPDGRKKAEGGLSWRKNTNTAYCSPTSNYRGADLNRNFSFKWGCCGGSSGYECDETYRGPTPASEPETQAIQDYVRAQFSDERDDGDLQAAAPLTTAGIFLDVHSYGELVLWPWGFTDAAAPNGAALQTLGRKLAYFNGYFPTQAYGFYPTDGTTDDFAYGVLGLPAYTFEVGTRFFQSCSLFENTIVPANVPALLYLGKVARVPYVWPAGPDTLDVVVTPTRVTLGQRVTLTAVLDDGRYNKQHGVESAQPIQTAEYYVDTPPWTTGASAHPIPALDGALDETREEIQATFDVTSLEAGRYLIFVRGQDAEGIWGPVSAAFLDVGAPVLPTAAFTTNSPVELGRAVLFTSFVTGTPPLNYMWDFGDGHGRSMSESPVYTYATSGTFTVTLTVTNSWGTDQATQTVTVLDLPYATWQRYKYVNGVLTDTTTVYVADTDQLQIVDRIWVTYTYGVTFTLAESWSPFLALTDVERDVGEVAQGDGSLTWRAMDVVPQTSYAVTMTFSVLTGTWETAVLTAYLNVARSLTPSTRRILTVEHQHAHLALDPMSFDMTVVVGEVVTRVLSITNTGDADLVWGLVTEVPWIVLPGNTVRLPGTLAPRYSRHLPLVFDTTADTALSPRNTYTTTLVVMSNDLERPQVDIPIKLSVRPPPRRLFLPLLLRG